MSIKKFLLFLMFFCHYFLMFSQKVVQLKGNFFVKNFTNKAGEQTNLIDYYFYANGNYALIKNCESNYKVTPKCHLQKAIILAIEKDGLIDQCEENSLVQSRTGKYISIENAITETNFSFKICDISGNCVILREDTLYYEPILTEQSSSGLYNGGQSKAIHIDRNDRIWLIRNFKKTLNNSENELFNSRKKGEYYIVYSGLYGDIQIVSRDLKNWNKFKRKILKKLG
jgi:hypothetical protein